jgi:hypothetical protein
MILDHDLIIIRWLAYNGSVAVRTRPIQLNYKGVSTLWILAYCIQLYAFLPNILCLNYNEITYICLVTATKEPDFADLPASV